MHRRTVEEHLFGDGPKRMLAIDGGGLRGALALPVLARIEDLLRARHGDETLLLCDYFDIIGGTSTGAIIAAGLANGMPVEELRALYHSVGKSIFRRSWSRWGLFRSKYRAQPLREALEGRLGGIEMGGAELHTGLMIVAKRLDTGSPWILHNNPRGKYYEARNGGFANRNYQVINLVRASTAAPTFFKPEEILVAQRREDGHTKSMTGLFVDGGVSPHNNPALQMLLLATLKGFALTWPLGADKLLLVSVGTGMDEQKPLSWWRRRISALLGVEALTSLMRDANWFNQLILQCMSSPRRPWFIDGEIGDLGKDVLREDPLFSYARYDVVFERSWLAKELGVDMSAKEVRQLGAMDRVDLMARWEELGAKAAGTQVDASDFPKAFDIS